MTELLLSICIPTYNRAHWLRFVLPLWVEQARQFPGECEIVVSDNDSTDDTADYLRDLQSQGLIRYSRNEVNIGGGPNFYKLVSELARGKYVWATGDDDFPAPGAIERALDVMRQQPELEYICVNYTVLLVNGPPLHRTMSDALLESSARTIDFMPRRLDRLVEIVGLDMNIFTPVGNSIFLRSQAPAAYEGLLLDKEFASARSVSSHALYIAENLLQKSVYYSGHPWIILSSNSTWEEYQSFFALKLLPDIMDSFVVNGADKGRMEDIRRQLIKQSWPLLQRIIFDPTTKHRNIFSLKWFLWRHRSHIQTWIALTRALVAQARAKLRRRG